MNLGEAAARFLATLGPGATPKTQQEVNRFVNWFGRDRFLDQVAPPEIGRYGEQVSTSSPDPARDLEPVKAFLSFAKKVGLTGSNYGIHLRAKKSTTVKSRPMEVAAAQCHQMTQEGYGRVKAELESLIDERPHVVEEIRKAAADKDFRENAPLQAAKERQGYLEGRIQELEAVLKNARVVSEDNGERIGLGHVVTLAELGSGEEMCFSIVHATEANPAKGKISMASPLGKALLGRKAGDEVDVVAPAGVIRYRVTTVAAGQS